MRLSSARELQQQLLGNLQPSEPEDPRFDTRSSGGAAVIAVTQSRTAAAVGIFRRRRRRDFGVAVRVYRGQDEQVLPMLAAIKAADDEIDVATGVEYSPRVMVRSGVSCGHYRITAGTLGGFVEDDDKYYLLSNNHVLADSNKGSPGDPIYMPGPADGRKHPCRTIGRLARFVPLASTQPTCVDAAIAEFDESVTEFEPWFYGGIGECDPRAFRDRYDVTNVIKRGKATQVTRGSVRVYELNGVEVNYGSKRSPFWVRFDDQIEILGHPQARPFSQPGDSGSVILDRDSLRPYALLFAGGRDKAGVDRTVAHFLPTVLDALNVRLIR